MKAPLKPLVTEGATYFDRPVVVAPTVLKDPVRMAVSAALNGGRANIPPRITVRHERVRLRWMKPDANGNLVPK